MTLRAERQSAQMSKITNDGLTRSGTHSCSHMTTVGVKGLTWDDSEMTRGAARTLDVVI